MLDLTEVHPFCAPEAVLVSGSWKQRNPLPCAESLTQCRVASEKPFSDVYIRCTSLATMKDVGKLGSRLGLESSLPGSYGLRLFRALEISCGGPAEIGFFSSTAGLY